MHSTEAMSLHITACDLSTWQSCCRYPHAICLGMYKSRPKLIGKSSVGAQVRLATVLDHVLDTVQHLLKKKVALERAIDPDTPDIIADGSRIVQVCPLAMPAVSMCFSACESTGPAALHKCHWHLATN